MLIASDLKLIIAAGEGYNAEFKVSIPSKVKELTEEICAFANAAGGTLLIGVNDNNEIKGVTIDNSKRSAIQNSISEISPMLHCSLSIVEIDGKSIGVINVPSGPDKPYVLSGAIYVRIGPNTQKLTTAEQMRSFFQQADKIHFDEVPSKSFNSMNDIDIQFFETFKLTAGITTSVPDHQIFTSLQLFAENGSFKNGAVLFFGKHPESLIQTAVLRCVSFRGTHKRFISDDKTYGGPLYHQFLNGLEWLRGKLNVGYDIEGQGAGPRKDVWEIPENVLKEALINALAHRDYYDKGATITIELFDDRVEITNPGGLISVISKTEFGKKSHSRNPLIFGLFTRMQMVEKIGSGIKRMSELMLEANLPEPSYSTEGMFTVTLGRPLKNIVVIPGGNVSGEMSGEMSGEIGTQILNIIKSNQKITIPEIAGKLAKTARTIERQIQKLKEDGRLVRVGSNKTGHWEVK